MTTLPTWQKLLLDRGILERARLHQWEPQGAGWLYPVHQDADGRIYHRWKAFDSSAVPKYSWPDGKPTDCKYYTASGLIRAVEDTNTLYIASGEPDLLTLESAGLFNALCWFGEQNIPPTLIQDFHELQAETIHLYPDLDETGDRAAQKLYELLSGSDIELVEHRLPDTLGHKGDLNRLWIACHFDADAFTDALLVCPEVQRHVEPIRPAYDELPDAYYAAIEQACHVTGYKADGWSKPFPCPLSHPAHEHDQDRPAAAWHREKHIFNCFKCGDGDMLAIPFGARLGLDWHDYIPPRQTVLTVPSADLLTPPDGKVKPRVIYSWTEATDTVLQEIDGEVSDALHEPLPMPFHNVRQMGGLAASILPRKMIAVVGDSGDGKTSFIETLIDYWRKRGFAGAIWGPEWSKEEYVYRAIQRQGGPSFMEMVDHKAWHAARKRGVPEPKRPGAPLSDGARGAARPIAETMKAWPGNLYFVEKLGVSVSELTLCFDEIIKGCQVAGERLAFLACDYAQLFQAQGERTNERLDRALAQMKGFIADRDLVAVIGTQVTKSEGAFAAHGEHSLSQHAMQNIRGDYFNLILSINREVDAQGVKSPNATIYVAKNSLGRNGPCDLTLDEKRLRWCDLEIHLEPPC